MWRFCGPLPFQVEEPHVLPNPIKVAEIFPHCFGQCKKPLGHFWVLTRNICGFANVLIQIDQKWLRKADTILRGNVYITTERCGSYRFFGPG